MFCVVVLVVSNLLGCSLYVRMCGGWPAFWTGSSAEVRSGELDGPEVRKVRTCTWHV